MTDTLIAALLTLAGILWLSLPLWAIVFYIKGKK